MKNKKVYITVAKLSLTVLIFVILFLTFDINLSEVFSGIVAIRYIGLALIIPLCVIPVISANRWRLFLHYVGVNESSISLIKINLVSMFQGIVLPSSQGFDIVRILHIETKHPEQRGKVGSTVLIERLLGFVVLCSISLISTWLLDLPNKARILVIIGLITFCLLVAIALLLNKSLNSFLAHKHFNNHFIDKCYQYFSKLATSLTYFPYNKILLSSVLLILLFQLSTIASVFLIFKAYGVDLPFTTHLSLYPIISILSLIPITISGFGIREGFFVYFYSQLGVPAEIAVSVSLMNYMVLTLVPALIGAVIYVIDIFKKK